MWSYREARVQGQILLSLLGWKKGGKWNKCQGVRTMRGKGQDVRSGIVLGGGGDYLGTKKGGGGGRDSSNNW